MRPTVKAPSWKFSEGGPIQEKKVTRSSSRLPLDKSHGHKSSPPASGARVGQSAYELVEPTQDMIASHRPDTALSRRVAILPRKPFKAVSTPFDLVLGRRTYDIFAAHWPHATEEDGAKPFNAAIKYVAFAESSEVGVEQLGLDRGRRGRRHRGTQEGRWV
jgi:hypothetical protein